MDPSVTVSNTTDNNSQSIPSPVSAHASVLHLNREVLFPSEVAISVGLDPNRHAILEVPNGSSSLYNSILLYAANFAVDIDEPLHACPPSGDPSSPPPLSDPQNPSYSLSPKPFTDNLKPIGPPTDESMDQNGELPNIVRGITGVNIPQREGSGRLSTLWNCPEDMFDSLSLSESENESDCEPDYVFDTSNSSAVKNQNADGIADNSEISTDILDGTCLVALKSKVEPPIQRYQMGIGYAKILVGGHVVFLHHCSFGLPVSESYSIHVFRTIALAAEDSFQLKELCALALKWRSDRDQGNQLARAGRFNLFRWKTNVNGCGDWCNQGYKRSRSAKSVILPDGQLEAIVKDIKDFVAADTKTWYEAHGVPHRRSYLFHGPPGSGKSSTIKMIAGMFGLNACFLGLTSADFNNQILQDALTSMPRRALLVLEDVDVLFNEDRKSEASQALTFSGMLNALDGLISMDGVITIFSTNHLEQLDTALIRGGRVDRRFEFVHPSGKQMVSFFKSFYEDAPDEIASRFADLVLSRPEEEARSIATLQQHFIYTRKMTAKQSVELIPKFFEEFYPHAEQTRNNIYS